MDGGGGKGGREDKITGERHTGLGIVGVMFLAKILIFNRSLPDQKTEHEEEYRS